MDRSKVRAVASSDASLNQTWSRRAGEEVTTSGPRPMKRIDGT
jgi:hypothetical protein